MHPLAVPSSRPYVSLAVIIVNFNGGGLLAACLAALERQRVRAQRVIVVDNASSDDSITRCRSAFPAVEYLIQGTNVGFAAANNIGVTASADCDWIALLNPDTEAGEGWIQAFQRAVPEFPNAHSFASCMLWAKDPSKLDGAGDVYRVDGLAWPRLQGQPRSAMPRQPDEVFAPCGGAGFYRRDTYIEVGGLCERFFCYYEDVDLGFRFRLRGHGSVFLPEAVVIHHGSALTGGQASRFSVYHVHRNFVWTFVRNMPGNLFWRHLPGHLLANLASVVTFIRKGEGQTIARAKWHAIRGLRAAWQERRLIQENHRKIDPAAAVAWLQPGGLFHGLFKRWRSTRQGLSG